MVPRSVLAVLYCGLCRMVLLLWVCLLALWGGPRRSILAALWMLGCWMLFLLWELGMRRMAMTTMTNRHHRCSRRTMERM
eukprot:14462605-Ditylum_brightwellii.AAC.1